MAQIIPYISRERGWPKRSAFFVFPISIDVCVCPIRGSHEDIVGQQGTVRVCACVWVMGLEQVLGSTAMWAAQGKIKKKYGIEDEREALFTAIKDWTDALEGTSGPFIGGERPNLGDLCVFGCIAAIEGLDTHRDVLARGGLGPWYNQMKETLDY